MHHASLRSEPQLVRDWQPVLPAGVLRAIVLHWTAGDYVTVFPAYHFCLSGSTDVSVAATHDLCANMRDLHRDQTGGYAAHVAGRNSFTAGIAVCAMRAATPFDFAAFPVTDAQIEALCIVSARLARHYGIAIENIRTHAEAALDDGYFGAAGDDERWDIARLAPSDGPLLPAEAALVGNQLRARIARCCS